MLVDVTKRERIELPNEPGEWIELRPMSSGDAANTSNDQYTSTLEVLVKVITAWSYTVPLTKENIYLLDMNTIRLLSGELAKISNVRSDEEKKGSPTPSLASSE